MNTRRTAALMTTTRTRLLRPWALWMVGFLAFPVAGLAGRAVAGPVDDLRAAVLGGAVTGLVLGAGQYLAARGALRRRWIPATALGMAVGLGVGAAAVGYRTSLGDLALMGVLTGVPLGVAQVLALSPTTHPRWLWGLTTPVLWGLGWTVTTLGGIAVADQFTIFGAYGAITFCALSGLVLHGVLLRDEQRTPST
ncbi:hypothetical protein [Pseudonocardia lacus]|uniref:hypothetical protein n=1 Tax=Pseudonocardia lacus TaxID=2835865 RepID=UPI001BDD768D|nr:hypothetical protein [Pseudonocardia lacus]